MNGKTHGKTIDSLGYTGSIGPFLNEAVEYMMMMKGYQNSSRV